MTDEGQRQPTALVIGARGGIGRAVVTRLLADGWLVRGSDSDDFDASTTSGVEAMFSWAMDEMATLDAVVHTVGMSGRSLGDGPVSSCTDEAWDEILRVNLGSVFRCLRASLPVLTPGRGSFVAVSSVLADSADPDFMTAAYAASKGALNSLIRVGAFEATQGRLRVNAVAPGLVDTPMASRALKSPAIERRMEYLQPLRGRAATPEEVASAIVWLASVDSAMTTGHILSVDGGWLLR